MYNISLTLTMSGVLYLPIFPMSGFGVRPNQARAQPPSLRLQSTDGILEFQKIKSTFRSFP